MRQISAAVVVELPGRKGRTDPGISYSAHPNLAAGTKAGIRKGKILLEEG